MRRRKRPEPQTNYGIIHQEAIDTWPKGTFMGQQYAVGPEANILVILDDTNSLAQGPFSVGTWLAQNGFSPSNDAFGEGTWVHESGEYIWVTDPKAVFTNNRRPPGIYQLNSKTMREMRGGASADKKRKKVSVKGVSKNLPAKADPISLPEGGSKDDGITVLSEGKPSPKVLLAGAGGLLAIVIAAAIFSGRGVHPVAPTTGGFVPVIPRERHIDALLSALEKLSVSNPRALLARHSEILDTSRRLIELASPGATNLNAGGLPELAAKILELDEVRVELVKEDPALFWPPPHVWLTPAHQVRMALLGGSAAERMKKLLTLLQNLQEAETANSELPKETLQNIRELLMDIHGRADQKLGVISSLDMSNRATLLGDLQILGLNLQATIRAPQLKTQDVVQLLQGSKAVAIWLSPNLVQPFSTLEDQWGALSPQGQEILTQAFGKLLEDSGDEIMALLKIRKIIESRATLALPQQATSPAPQQAGPPTTSGRKFGTNILSTQ